MTIKFDDATYALLWEIANNKGISLAKLVSQIADEYVEATK